MMRDTDQAPHWVVDNSVIRRILNTFIDKVESSQQLKMFVNSRKIPELYDFDNFDTEELWRLIVSKLQIETGIINIRFCLKLSIHDLPYEKAKLTFASEHETKVREWLDRPVTQNYRLAWRAAMAEVNPTLLNPDAFIAPIHFAGRSASETVDGFVRLAQALKQLDKRNSSLSLRTLSARCFWGNSKLLDGRRPFLENAFPSAQTRIQPRAIMMSVYVPSDITTALFIENFDSFRSTVAALKKTPYNAQTAVIYSAGFRGSAERIRESGNAQFVLMNQVAHLAYQQFQQWWYAEHNNTVTCYFWGDLDFSGMAILKAMRVRFKTIQAWQGAYRRTIQHHQSGANHLAKDAKKEQQHDPELTGCSYADHKLLPLIRKSQTFTDQEVVCEQEIIKAINELFQAH